MCNPKNLIGMKNLCLILLLAACALPMRAETAAADTVATELKEVVVKSERAWIDGEKVVFIPTKREKNLSNSPESLLEKMNLPVLTIINNRVMGLNGKDVVYFINGVRAESTDIATFWPKQAQRVEYMENPTDPRYEGCSSVVNFVMTEYEVGGVTRLEADQTFPNDGSYSAANKLVYHKMTYGVMFDGGYSRNHSSSSWGEDNYNGIYYNGVQYDNVKREYEGRSWSRNDKISAGLNVRYVSDKITATHTLGFRWDRNPGSGSYDAESWSRNLFNSSSSVSNSSGRSASPQLSGRYQIKFDPGWSMFTSWNYGYSHNDNHSTYCSGELEPIYNATEEDVHTAGLFFVPTFKPSEKYFAQIYLSSNMNWFSTQYEGSADRKVDQWRGMTSATLRFAWIPSKKFWIDLQPGLNATYWKVGGMDYSKVEPKGELNLFFRISRQLYVTARVSYFSLAPSASQSGDVMVQQNELMWMQGNPSLHNEISWWQSVDVVWMPADWFNASLSSKYSRNNNVLVNRYAVADAEYGGVVNTYMNGGSEDRYSLFGFMNANFFDNALHVQLQPELHYAKSYGEYADNISRFRLRGGVNYDIGNCNFSVSYNGPEKYINKLGMERGWHSDQWNFSFTYGNGDLYLSVGVSDIFNRSFKSWTELRGDVYSSVQHDYSIGRSLNVSLSYTFGYGKKVEKGIDIDSPQKIESGALGS